ncbi:B12-binding domain-containing radical SAM protein [Actinoplanes lobatus]|uniref:B12-binding domain-containing radical SAM protein n=1 Tax=Actinoplanes lobatus TaxID=113568 RepID=A0A7W7MHM9_9ACTN|nr:TIGR04013 family B12-binding domain/radical SAM domain-containing protein [Actinoplanes lobatus]MBB4750526.1 B12-binding domain/radical SAM domain protein [Actinoplanes lobatus]GGN90403.1 B12-binding domain-containing radical SAM protein [Actinoplanes lobatus]GIE43796.1 B12-binding domain-containing radical SAM protein [Actinoplanes lobatus]
MGGPELVLVLRYRKAVTYGFHALLGALGQHETATRYEVRFGEDVESAAAQIRDAVASGARVYVLWSFYSPDAAALAEELKQIRALADAPNVTHLAGGVHATAEPVQTLDAGWDMAAIGEGESTLLSLVDAKGDPTGITGLAYRDATGNLIRTGKAKQRDLNDFPGFALKWDKFNALEITRGCIYACRFCQTPFMFSAKFRHRSIENVRWHVDQMRARGLRDVRFITPTALSYGSQTDEPNLDAVEELLASCREGIGPNGRVFFGSFPSEIRPEHVSREALRLVKKYCDNNNIIVGAQSGSDRVLDAAKRGHSVEEVMRAARLGIEEGFRINVDMIFGMPGENQDDVDDSLTLARELADLGARIHAHTFMPLPGTPWRDAPPGDVDPETIREVDRLSRRGALYGHWQKQRDHAARLAAAAEAYPRPGRSRTILPTVPAAAKPTDGCATC